MDHRFGLLRAEVDAFLRLDALAQGLTTSGSVMNFLCEAQDALAEEIINRNASDFADVRGKVRLLDHALGSPHGLPPYVARLAERIAADINRIEEQRAA